MKITTREFPILNDGFSTAYGVSYLNRSVCFKVIHLEAEECFLKLYHQTDVSKNQKIRMDRVIGTKHAFVTVIDDLEYSEYEYCFEAMQEDFLEPSVKVVHGRDTFGLSCDQAQLRGGFLTRSYRMEEKEQQPISYEDMIIYKLHVRGFTMHETSGVKYPGTYRGVIEKIPYLKDLGVNTILLMPITEFDERFQQNNYYEAEDKINYWGYGSDCYYYAPKTSYASNKKQPDVEVKQMVEEFHKNGMEVLLEMNFNYHTNPVTIVDCLSYWHMEYGIDGFRTNIPEQYRSMVAASPLLQEVKLLDVWGNIDEIKCLTNGVVPKWLAEYNDSFELIARRFLKGEEAQVNSFMNRLKHKPNEMAVVNYITNHDGFTLHDLYTFDVKHNEPNGENNQDGSEYNYSWNCGFEGETRRKKVVELRKQMVKNALLTLFLAQGTPLLLSGDEFGNSQCGNNNAYCQDNEISWINWKLKDKNKELLQFVKKIIAFRKAHVVFHQERELRSMDYIYCGMPDISFHGTKAWQPNQGNYSRELGVLLCGKYAAISRVKFDSTFYLIFNMHWEKHDFDLPILHDKLQWGLIEASDYSLETPHLNISDVKPLENQRTLTVPPRTICILVGI